MDLPRILPELLVPDLPRASQASALLFHRDLRQHPYPSLITGILANLLN